MTRFLLGAALAASLTLFSGCEVNDLFGGNQFTVQVGGTTYTLDEGDTLEVTMTAGDDIEIDAPEDVTWRVKSGDTTVDGDGNTITLAQADEDADDDDAVVKLEETTDDPEDVWTASTEITSGTMSNDRKFTVTMTADDIDTTKVIVTVTD